MNNLQNTNEFNNEKEERNMLNAFYKSRDVKYREMKNLAYEKILIYGNSTRIF